MIRLSSPWLLLILGLLGGAHPANASENRHLDWAILTTLRNRVQLKPHSQPLRPAQQQDQLRPGDSLATARSALAEMRFNDGTLARMGENAVFRFLPQTRTMHLNQGTLLLLIPPGQGQTQLTTPNVLTGIRGSALFVRHHPASRTTLVGALTDSGIEVSTGVDAPFQVLQAGQMVVIVADRIEGLYEFDLKTFYSTSDLAQGLGPNLQTYGPRAGQESTDSQADPQADLEVIRQEMVMGLQGQTSFTPEGDLAQQIPALRPPAADSYHGGNNPQGRQEARSSFHHEGTDFPPEAIEFHHSETALQPEGRFPVEAILSTLGASGTSASPESSASLESPASLESLESPASPSSEVHSSEAPESTLISPPLPDPIPVAEKGLQAIDGSIDQNKDIALPEPIVSPESLAEIAAPLVDPIAPPPIDPLIDQPPQPPSTPPDESAANPSEQIEPEPQGEAATESPVETEPREAIGEIPNAGANDQPESPVEQLPENPGG